MEHKPKHNPFHAFSQLVGLEFVEIAKYVKEASEGLKVKEIDFNTRLMAMASYVPEFTKPGFLQTPRQLNPFILREKYNYEYKFFHLLRGSALISSYSLLESSLSDACELAKRQFNLQLSYKDIKGDSTLHVFKKYLTKVVGVKLDDLNADWEKINTNRLIRNKIVHDLSRIDKDSERHLYAKMKEMDSIDLLDGEFLIMDNKLIIDFLESASNYFMRTSIKLQILWDKYNGIE